MKLRRKGYYEDWHGFGRRQRCAECRVLPCPDWYMLRDDIWRGVAAPQQFLCLGCVEARLGRPLVRADFADVPINDAILAQFDHET